MSTKATTLTSLRVGEDGFVYLSVGHAQLRFTTEDWATLLAEPARVKHDRPAAEPVRAQVLC